MMNEQTTATDIELDSECDEGCYEWTKDYFLSCIREGNVSLKSKSSVLHEKYRYRRRETFFPVDCATYNLKQLLEEASKGRRYLGDAIAVIDAINVDELMAECTKEMKAQLAALREAIKDVVANTDPKAKDPTKKRYIPPKYFNPADPSQTWSGCGSEPVWIKPYRVHESYRWYQQEVDIAHVEEAKAKLQERLEAPKAEVINFSEARKKSQHMGYGNPFGIF